MRYRRSNPSINRQIMDNPERNRNIQIDRTAPEILSVRLSGQWVLDEGLPSSSELKKTIESTPGLKRLEFDGEAITIWDSGLVVFLRNIANYCKKNNIEIDDTGIPQGARMLLKSATEIPVKEEFGDPMESSLLARIGDVSLRLTRSGSEILAFTGEVFLSFMRWFRGKAQFRRTDMKIHLEQAGIQALPIVTLINFLIGVIIAFVSAIQLQQFGAEIFVADLVAIAMAREMGPMMTAIILAGRSGASYAAQIGTMMVNEEVDALKTAGFSPIDFLVLPRILALTLMTPLLALYADFMGMIGGGVVGLTMLDLSSTLYIQQTISALHPIHFVLGLIKAGIYGALVAYAGCMTGMQSGRSASAVGEATTKAVVMSIVLVIVASAVTTVIYSLLGI
jgi:phospholipid/cholesterol/gamma-HCH transport system permease protein